MKGGVKTRARRQACCYQWGLKPAIAVYKRDFMLLLKPQLPCLLSPTLSRAVQLPIFLVPSVNPSSQAAARRLSGEADPKALL